MNESPLLQADNTQLANAVQENLFDLFRAMTQRLPGSDLVETSQLCLHHAFPTSPLFKGVWRSRLAPGDVNTAIDQTLEWFKARQAPYIFWWVGPGTQPADLPQRLMAHGFSENFSGDAGMAVEFSALNAAVQTPGGFSVQAVENEQGLLDWRDAFSAGFEVPVWAGQAWVDATLQTGIAAAPWRLYVGYLDGKPVATNILYNGAGVAGLYGVGTIPEARRKGIGAMITLKPLLDARDLGYRFGVLFASEMGYPVYKRLGFHPVDCKIGRYLWINER